MDDSQVMKTKKHRTLNIEHRTSNSGLQMETAKSLDNRMKDQCFATVSKCWERIREIAGSLKEQQIEFVNLFRECGVAIQEATGHEQLTIEVFNHHLARLPRDMDFAGAKFCTSIARALPKPTKDFAEAQRQLDMGFQVVGLLEAPHRSEPGVATERFSMPWFVNRFSSLAVEAGKFVERMPLERLAPAQLDTVIAQTKAVAELHRKARELRGN